VDAENSSNDRQGCRDRADSADRQPDMRSLVEGIDHWREMGHFLLAAGPSRGASQSLAYFLGMTWDEYCLWAEGKV
jgi:hypothetical protein